MRSRRRGEGTPPYGVVEVRCRRVVGEIGEAPPVAEEASRFRGSAPIGGHDSGRESAGTTVGNRRPLRSRGRVGGRDDVGIVPYGSMRVVRCEGSTDCHTSLRAGSQ